MLIKLASDVLLMYNTAKVDGISAERDKNEGLTGQSAAVVSLMEDPFPVIILAQSIPAM